MNYLSVENLSKSFGEKVLFDNLSFGIEKGQKVALIARNGYGKTTLLNILMQKELPDAGRVVFRNDLKVGYLPQNPIFNLEDTIMDVLFNADTPRVQAIQQYEKALTHLKKEETAENHKALELAMIEMENTQAWNYEEKVKEVLYRLKITDLEQKIGELSGGQRKKVALSKVLLEELDLLILDEPTNHLDIEMTEWLEEFLSRQSLAILLITHDRSFLNAVCSEILEIDQRKMFFYKGTYSYFLEKKAERELAERAAIEKAQNLYKRELDWMRRMPSARTTKSKSRIDAFYQVKEKAFQRLDKDIPELSVKAERVGGKILELNHVCKSFGDKKMIDEFSYIFKKGDKIGIVGKNGIGKSTLLNIITGALRVDKGSVVVGQTIKFGYYQQDGLKNQEDKRVIDIVKEVAEVVRMENGAEISASQFLTYFQFDTTTQYNYFSNLSGGEKRRLYLIMTLMSNPNFLILDEPTNDLDVFTLMLLEDFLVNFQGCLLMVSHDRSFMDNLTEHLFVFEGEGKIKDYYGTYSEYKAQAQKEQKVENAISKENTKTTIERAPSNVKKRTYKEQKELEEIEIQLPLLEEQKKQIEDLLAQGTLGHEDILVQTTKIGEVLAQIDALSMRWLELSE